MFYATLLFPSASHFSLHNKESVISKPSRFCKPPLCRLMSRPEKQFIVENTHKKIYCP